MGQLMPASLHHAIAFLLLPVTAVTRLLRFKRYRRGVGNDRYLARVRQAEVRGDEAFLDRELARLQPTAGSLRRTERPSPSDADWPDENLNDLFGPEIAGTANKPG